jgi:hypothetical protein
MHMQLLALDCFVLQHIKPCDGHRINTISYGIGPPGAIEGYRFRESEYLKIILSINSYRANTNDNWNIALHVSSQIRNLNTATRNPLLMSSESQLRSLRADSPLDGATT